MRLAPVDFFSWLWNAVELIQFGQRRSADCMGFTPFAPKGKK